MLLGVYGLPFFGGPDPFFGGPRLLNWAQILFLGHMLSLFSWAHEILFLGAQILLNWAQILLNWAQVLAQALKSFFWGPKPF